LNENYSRRLNGLGLRTGDHEQPLNPRLPAFVPYLSPQRFGRLDQARPFQGPLNSVGGMMLMSSLLSLPTYFTAARFAGAYRTVRLLAGCFSFGFGIWMMYEIGFVSGLLR
jgi:hypothetical protein